jgi:hypothetical protein
VVDAADPDGEPEAEDEASELEASELEALVEVASAALVLELPSPEAVTSAATEDAKEG